MADAAPTRRTHNPSDVRYVRRDQRRVVENRRQNLEAVKSVNIVLLVYFSQPHRQQQQQQQQ